MVKYTTGEMAKLCNTTVRTVQYYDSREILVPSELSEGGRRLYSEEDLKKLKIICFLREMDIPIDAIRKLFHEKNQEAVIAALLEEQGKLLEQEISVRKEKLKTLENLKDELKVMQPISVESIGDIAHIMENKKNLRKVRRNVLLIGLFMEAIEAAALILWIMKGIWQPFILWILMEIILGYYICSYYFHNVIYICPQCHTVFKPGFWEAFWARHTPKTRKLRCPQCDHHGFCVETYGGNEHA